MHKLPKLPGNGHADGHKLSRGDMDLTSHDCIALEEEYLAHNYHPLPIVLARGEGAHVWDPEGKKYIDCLSSYGAVNQGHCHPRILAAMVEQAQRLTLSSRAFHNDLLGVYSKKVTQLLGFDMVLPVNTGAEAVETALKLARKWAYRVKGVEPDKAIVLSVTENFHGRTLGMISMSTDPDATSEFGPFLQAVGPACPVKSSERTIRYNNVDDLDKALQAHGKDVAAFLVEPIQGEAGILIPDDDYLERCQALCQKHNVLLICDEIQCGLGRTGKMLCFQHDPRVKPDIVTLGKALSGGLYPVSAVLANKDVMLTIRPGEHGSTYGGNPLACAVAIAALDVLVDENLAERADRLGRAFARRLESLKSVGADPKTGRGGWIKEYRAKGLFCAIDIDKEHLEKIGRSAWDLCLLMASKGVLAKPTHDNTIRLAPPLVISEEDLDTVVRVIQESLQELDNINHIPEEECKGQHDGASTAL